MVAWTESTIEIGGTKIHLTRGGKGPPLLVLHHDIGTLERLPFYDALAKSRRARAAPSRARTLAERPDWMRSVRDVAVDLPVAARRARRLATASRWSGSASAAGSRPRWRRWRRARSAGWCWSAPWASSRREGEILDQALVSYIDYVRAGFDDQEAFDARLRRRAADRPARAVGPQPRDDVPHRLEAVHVQPDAAAPAGRRAGAGAGRVGRRRPDRAARVRRALRGGAAAGAGSRSSRAPATASRWSSRTSSPGSSRAFVAG